MIDELLINKPTASRLIRRFREYFTCIYIILLYFIYFKNAEIPKLNVRLRTRTRCKIYIAKLLSNFNTTAKNLYHASCICSTDC